MLDTNQIGVSSIVLRRNELPTGGLCTISPSTGYAIDTLFTLNCINWVDLDGNIVNYQFYGKIFEIKEVR
jgi:hypothetical protein